MSSIVYDQLSKITDYLFETPVAEWKRDYKHMTKYVHLDCSYSDRLEIVQTILNTYDKEQFLVDWAIMTQSYRYGYLHPVRSAFGALITNKLKSLLLSLRNYQECEISENMLPYTQDKIITAADIVQLGESAMTHSVLFMYFRGWTKTDLADYFGIDRSIPRRILRNFLAKWESNNERQEYDYPAEETS